MILTLLCTFSTSATVLTNFTWCTDTKTSFAAAAAAAAVEDKEKNKEKD